MALSDGGRGRIVLVVEAVYSARWREIFGRADPGRTAREVEFLLDVLPLPAFRRVLDVPCGAGRHAVLLGRAGYAVLGVDLDEGVVAEARAAGVDAAVGDMRDLSHLPDGFDALACLWASFGFFDAATNERVLAGFAERLRPGGRLVLDLPSAGFFSRHQGSREIRPGVLETSRVEAGRRVVELDYGEGVEDRISWQLYEPDELTRLARRHGLAPVLAAGGWDARTPPSANVPSAQVVFNRLADDRRHPSG